MKRFLLIGAAAALLVLLFGGVPAMAQNVALNNCFEMQSTVYWTKTGNMPAGYYGIDYFDTNGNAQNSWCFYQSPFQGKIGGISQTIFLIAGVTYDVSVDIAYYNC